MPGIDGAAGAEATFIPGTGSTKQTLITVGKYAASLRDCGLVRFAAFETQDPAGIMFVSEAFDETLAAFATRPGENRTVVNYLVSAFLVRLLECLQTHRPPLHLNLRPGDVGFKRGSALYSYSFRLRDVLVLLRAKLTPQTCRNDTCGPELKKNIGKKILGYSVLG